MVAAKIPVTVVTGFLGAGKTTFINYLLSNKEGKKIAIIENEFGEVGIDDGLVLETKEEVFEMNNGCVCCTVRGDLIRTLNKLLKRSNKFDAIVIETTGLADPAPVIQTFFVDDDIKEGCQLDAILTVVDTKHLLQHLDEVKPADVVNEAAQQVAYADKILLNKLDLVSGEEKKEVVRRIRAINAGAEVIECRHAQVDLSRVLGISAFNLDRLLEKEPEFLGEATSSSGSDSDDDGHDCHDPHCTHDHHHHHHDHKHGHDHDHKHGHDHDCHDPNCSHEHHEHEHGHEHAHEHGHDHGKKEKKTGSKKHKHHHHHHDHTHDESVTSVGITMPGSCDMPKLNEWLGKLLQERGKDLFRSKGILAVAGSEHKHVFQGVHMLLQFSSSAEGAGRPWAPAEPRVNKLVFIGRNLNRQELNDGFAACVIPPAAAV